MVSSFEQLPDEQLPDERLRMVYSTEDADQAKQDHGRRIHNFVRKAYWYVEEDENGRLSIQALNDQLVPSGDRSCVTLRQLAFGYTAEPQLYSTTVLPKMQKLEVTLERGDGCRKRGETFSAEFEYENALGMDEANIRANFGAGIIFLTRGEIGKADKIFKKLVQLEGSFEKHHKHLFNDFGMSLRKNNMHKQAIEYYSRALALSNEDENLHINIARPLFEQRQLGSCIEHLFEALRLDPHNSTATRFLRWLNKRQFVPKNMEEQVVYTLSQCIIPDQCAFDASHSDLELLLMDEFATAS